MKKRCRSARADDKEEPGALFPVVGIAASAAGVESFRRLLPHLPADAGMAFVIAPHGAAQPAGVLASLFARATPMPVREAAPQTVVEPNHVYVVPPDKPRHIVHSVLAPAPPAGEGAARRPIDYFFRSLAADCRALGIGLMLSPADADDVTGIQAIRESGGIPILQNESSARGCGGSSSVSPGVTAGIADLVLSPEEIGDALERIGRTTESTRVAKSPQARDLPGRLRKAVKNTRGIDCSFSKGDAMMALILRRMKLCQYQSLDGYFAYLESSKTEKELLAQDLLLSAHEENATANGVSAGVTEQSGVHEVNSLDDRLQQGNRELSRENDRLLALIGGMSIPILMVDRELRIKLMTPAAERMFNLRAGDSGNGAGNHLRNIQLSPGDEGLERRVRRVIDSGVAEEIELRALHGRCHLLRIEPCAATDDHIQNHKMKEAVITVLDIEELRQARSAAVLAGRFADAILESVPIPLLMLDGDLRILVANQAFLAANVLEPADVQNCLLEDLGADRWGIPEFKEAVRRLLSGETAFEELECQQQHPGFGRRAVLISARRVLWQGSARILIAIHDITAQRRAEALTARDKARLKRTARKTAAALHETEDALRQSRAELRALTGSLLHAQEEERRRVSRELHDDVSQDVVKLQFDIEALEQALPPDRTTEKQGLMAVRDDAARLSKDLRRIAYVLHPSTLDNLGLTGALSGYAAEFSKRTGIPVEFRTSGVPDTIPQEIASAYYRVTQEALRNIVRHSGAASTLSLTGENSCLILAIRDDGPGFERHAVRGRGGLGLVSMEERARLIGASFHLHTAPGEGVAITLSAPLGLLD